MHTFSIYSVILFGLFTLSIQCKSAEVTDEIYADIRLYTTIHDLYFWKCIHPHCAYALDDMATNKKRMAPHINEKKMSIFVSYVSQIETARYMENSIRIFTISIECLYSLHRHESVAIFTVHCDLTAFGRNFPIRPRVFVHAFFALHFHFSLHFSWEFEKSFGMRFTWRAESRLKYESISFINFASDSSADGLNSIYASFNRSSKKYRQIRELTRKSRKFPFSLHYFFSVFCENK